MKKQLSKLIDKYKQKIGLGECEIDIAISPDNHLFSERNGKAKDKVVDYCAEVTRRLHKEKAYTILFNKSAEGDLTDTVIHELLHCLFWELLSKAEALIDLSGLDMETQNRLWCELGNEEHFIIEKLIAVLK